MVRLTADLIWKSPHFFNAIGERELDLRGNHIIHSFIHLSLMSHVVLLLLLLQLPLHSNNYFVGFSIATLVRTTPLGVEKMSNG